jgi:hypothetical protein
VTSFARLLQPPALEQRAAACERFLNNHRLFLLTILTVLYFVLTILRARGKPFWYDEILTILEARQPTLTAALQAGRDADWMPPLSHVAFYLTDKLVGDGEVAFRLGPMIGFWVFCLCLFQFVARRASTSFAFMAMLLPFATLFSAYSFEARSYAMVLGFCGIALLGWQAAAEGRRRPIALAALGLGIAGALLNHYWALFIYLPLAGAEAYRNFRQSKIDWPVWIAFAASGIPLLVSLILILRVVQTSLHPWSAASPKDYFIFYGHNFWPVIAFIIPMLLLVGAWLFLRGRREKPEGLQPSTVRDYEWLAALLFFLAPIAAITSALVIPPHIYVDRYLAPSTTGFALLATFAAAHYAGRRAAIGIICAIAALSPFLFHFTQIRGRAGSPFLYARVLRQALATQAEPIVISNYISCVELWYYAPDDLKPRLLGLFDEQSSVRYRRMDDVAGDSLRALGVPFYSYREFATSGKQFLIYFVDWSWMTNQVLEDGGTLESLPGASPHGELIRAHIK